MDTGATGETGVTTSYSRKIRMFLGCFECSGETVKTVMTLVQQGRNFTLLQEETKPNLQCHIQCDHTAPENLAYTAIRDNHPGLWILTVS